MDQNEDQLDWKFTERVVALLEKVISPHAKVEHNVHLPVILGSSTRQCDIVITMEGQSSRPIYTLVEVQNRKKKPEINDFCGWIEKIRDVGAQRLICVSETGYPKSIIEKAKTLGATVILMTLEELQNLRIGDLDLSHFIRFKPIVNIEDIGQMDVFGLGCDARLELTGESKVFSMDDDPSLLTISELSLLCLELSDKKGLVPETYIQNSFLKDIDPTTLVDTLWLTWENKKYKILKFPIKLRIDVTKEKIPTTQAVYRQDGVDSPLAWVAMANNKEFGMIFKKER